MILRRVIKHVRNQEWTAIVIDFFIVVFGVFVGLQVQQWNESRVDEGRAKAYLSRAQNDLNADLFDYQIRLDFWEQVSDYGTSGLDYVSTGQVGNSTYWQLLLAFFHASQVAEFNTTRTTYDELTSSGEQNLITNVKIRDALANYYSEAGNATFTERPKYRENVRGIIPISVQSYIWENCYNSDEVGVQELLNCSTPIAPHRAEEIVNMIAGNTELMAELRYWMSTMTVATLIAHTRMKLANEMLVLIETELGSESMEATP
ncbi:MAG: hypothetical protein JKY46_08975 [Robiginitomaculum sp.]|nr:hypothetical protein [Robiginitomaculum sp.]